ncbi:hypothetical protein [Geobacter sp.]|uniref:hypothetical protein n=1 Tax=Geobacter sp. TaxID=46610 RepID=UPI00263806E1|nr:hypothetical protein [Geobacter sp.]
MVSQSGAILVTLLEALAEKGTGVSRAANYGNAVDIDAPDIYDYLADDADTEVDINHQRRSLVQERDEVRGWVGDSFRWKVRARTALCREVNARHRSVNCQCRWEADPGWPGIKAACLPPSPEESQELTCPAYLRSGPTPHDPTPHWPRPRCAGPEEKPPGPPFDGRVQVGISSKALAPFGAIRLNHRHIGLGPVEGVEFIRG